MLPLPLQAKAQLEPERALLSTCHFFLAHLKCISCGRQNCYFSWVTAQLKQELSNTRASMFEPGHAGNCSQQGIIFWNFLPTWGQDISASPVPFDGWIAETMWREDLSLWGVSADLVWALVCHLLCFGLAVMSFCLPHVVLCPLIGILFVASLKIKAELLLPHPTLKWNVLCK